MKKKILTTIVTSMLFLVPFASVNAEEENKTVIEESVVSSIKINDQLTIQKFSDGRVKGYPESNLLNESDKNKFLENMGFDIQEIQTMNSEMKNELISEGGKKVEISNENHEESYTDKNGEKHIITDENRDEVNNLVREQTFQPDSSSIGPMVMGSTQRGAFNGASSITYIGKTANAKEFKYSVKTSYYWTGTPLYGYTDSLGQGLSSNMLLVGSHGSRQFAPKGSSTWSNEKLDIVDQGTNLAKTTFFLKVAAARAYNQEKGYIASEVRIPVSEVGKTASFYSAYFHASTPVSADISFAGGSFSFSPKNGGEPWLWASSFIVGKSS